MFGSSNKSKRNTEIDSLVGGNTKICGDVHFTGGLHVDGVIEGNVIAGSDNSVLTTSEKGQINGNVTVHNIVLNGEVVGDVHALRHIELAPNARVTGNVYYNVIEMAMGAEVNGNLIHTKNGEKPESNLTQAAKEALDPQLPMDKVINK
ncbi:MAG: polymer-forming cytoskeletal protein [Gammaproteobacteria bacterium]|jgi:cytoskeletal protein CcmA (bactofilin family)